MSVNQTGTGNKQDTYEEEFQQNEFEVGFTEPSSVLLTPKKGKD